MLLKSQAFQPRGPGLMKGCEIQCENRFRHLLIWPCQSTILCQSSKHGAAMRACVHAMKHWGKGRLALSVINSRRRAANKNALRLFRFDIKAWQLQQKIIIERGGMKACDCTVSLKATTAKHWATYRIQRSNTWFSFPQQQIQSQYSDTNVNAVIHKGRWVEKGANRRK